MEDIRFDLQGKGHDIRIAPSARVTGRIRARDDAGPCSVHIGEGVRGKWDITVSGGARVVIGRATTCETTQIVAQGGGVLVGEDCMFSFAVEIRTTDTHAIYDVGSGGRVNPDEPIRIGDHVWLGKQAIVLKGADIGSGSVVGARGVASGRIPPLSVCVGVPARVVRSNAIWTRRVGQGRLDQDEKAMQVVQAVQATTRSARSA